ncbi:putative Sex-lethal like protein [Blattamonas nauphoetae]|uniref:Sex-lethal like protein n=1 Tax=Blattamonas nauphoetae TaxID=2049346 RepID=A0ABQ9YJX1_9EUKA|nr:putative Sex-lethal like protein [Blattamonas nauphoetae]
MEGSVPVDLQNLFVKYIPNNYTDSDLKHLFQPFGEIVSSKIMVDNATGHSLGFGFVRFARKEDAHIALNALNQKPFGRKRLLIKFSTLHADSQDNFRSRNLYVKNLLPDTTESDLRALFSPFGQIDDLRVIYDPTSHRSRQIGFVRFTEQRFADNALQQLQNSRLSDDSPPLSLKYAETEEMKNDRISRKVKARNPSSSYSGKKTDEIRFPDKPPITKHSDHHPEVVLPPPDQPTQPLLPITTESFISSNENTTPRDLTSTPIRVLLPNPNTPLELNRGGLIIRGDARATTPTTPFKLNELQPQPFSRPGPSHFNYPHDVTGQKPLDHVLPTQPSHITFTTNQVSGSGMNHDQNQQPNKRRQRGKGGKQQKQPQPLLPLHIAHHIVFPQSQQLSGNALLTESSHNLEQNGLIISNNWTEVSGNPQSHNFSTSYPLPTDSQLTFKPTVLPQHLPEPQQLLTHPLNLMNETHPPHRHHTSADSTRHITLPTIIPKEQNLTLQNTIDLSTQPQHSLRSGMESTPPYHPLWEGVHRGSSLNLDQPTTFSPFSAPHSSPTYSDPFSHAFQIPSSFSPSHHTSSFPSAEMDPTGLAESDYHAIAPPTNQPNLLLSPQDEQALYKTPFSHSSHLFSFSDLNSVSAPTDPNPFPSTVHTFSMSAHHPSRVGSPGSEKTRGTTYSQQDPTTLHSLFLESSSLHLGLRTGSVSSTTDPQPISVYSGSVEVELGTNLSAGEMGSSGGEGHASSFTVAFLGNEKRKSEFDFPDLGNIANFSHFVDV